MIWGLGDCLVISHSDSVVTPFADFSRKLDAFSRSSVLLRKLGDVQETILEPR